MNRTKCPSCRQLLEEAGPKPLETLSEHVSNPNGPVSLKMSYRCSGAECPTREAGIIWNSDGERYGSFSFDHKKFIGENDGPFGTISRKLNVEIHKKGLPEHKVIMTIGKKLHGPDGFANGAIRIMREFNYVSNEDGVVLKRDWKLVSWKMDRGTWTSYQWPLMSFFDTVERGIWHGLRIKRRKGLPRSGFETMYFSVGRWEERWWHIWGVRVNRLIFPSLVRNLPFRERSL